MRKFIYIFLFLLLSLISASLFYGIILLKDYSEATDISLYPIKNTNKKYAPEKTWLMSYASGDVFIQNQNNLNMSASMTQAFDVVISYQPHHIDPEYYEKHKDILSQARGVGYWLWKPYLILKTLEMMPENDVLFYIDRSVIFKDNIYSILESAQQHDITLSPGFHTNRRYMKKAVIDKIANGDESIRDKTQLESGFLLLRNNAKTREFVKEWLHYCEDPELLTDIPSENEYPDFVDHRHDQAILTALYYKNPKQYNLFESYKVRKSAFFVTRRHDKNYSTRSITFDKKLGNFNWQNAEQYFIDLKNFLIGPQMQEEPLCSLDETNSDSQPICIINNQY